METYISFGSYTQQGMSNMKEAPARVQAAKKAIEDAGGKWIAFYLTMGRHDFITITQSPNAELTATILLTIGGQGNVRTETMRAFPEEDFGKIVANLP